MIQTLERQSIQIEKPKFDMNEYHEKRCNQLKSKPFIQLFLKENGLDDSIIKDNLTHFIHYENEIKECESCHSLDTCPKLHKGYIEKLIYINHEFNSELVSCKKRKAAEEAELKEARLVFGQIPQKLKEVTLEKMLDDKVVVQDKTYSAIINQIVQYAPNYDTQKGIYLYGNPGVGKTYCMIALCDHLMKSGLEVAYIRVPEVTSDLKSISQEDIIKIKNADFAVFDDIGQESVTNAVRDEFLFNILNYRMDNEKSTCFTSNFSMKELTEHFSHSINNEYDEMKAVRLIERIKALSYEVKFVGKSKR